MLVWQGFSELSPQALKPIFSIIAERDISAYVPQSFHCVEEKVRCKERSC